MFYGTTLKDGKWVLGPYQVTKLKNWLEKDNNGRYIHIVELSEKLVHVIPLHKPDEFYFKIVPIEDGKFTLDWKSAIGESNSTQEFRKCQTQMRYWVSDFNRVIDGHQPYQEDVKENREVLRKDTKPGNSHPKTSLKSKKKFSILMFSRPFGKRRFSFWYIGIFLIGFLCGYFINLFINFFWIEERSWDERNFWLALVAILIAIIIALNSSRKG